MACDDRIMLAHWLGWEPFSRCQSSRIVIQRLADFVWSVCCNRPVLDAFSGLPPCEHSCNNVHLSWSREYRHLWTSQCSLLRVSSLVLDTSLCHCCLLLPLVLLPLSNCTSLSGQLTIFASRFTLIAFLKHHAYKIHFSERRFIMKEFW